MRDPEVAIFKHGWAVLEGVVPMPMIERMRVDLNDAYEYLRKKQEAAGLAVETIGTLHHLPALPQFRSFLEFLETNPAASHVADFFDQRPYVLQSFGGNMNFPNSSNYAAEVHRDIRSFFRDRLMINTLVALDDMTEENGATWFISGGHKMETKPGDGEWNAKAVQVTAPAGSILLWDSRLWHRAGVNRTDRPRRIVTPIFAVPHFKPGFDYCRALGEPFMQYRASDALKQVLGWNARIPATFEEWYQKPESRYYRGDQG